ncbi:MAG TPA: hypothetical protein VK466_18015 [Terriglobales bacterium]|nr:hypothetical protein [Terriglobales bacterium]
MFPFAVFKINVSPVREEIISSTLTLSLVAADVETEANTNNTAKLATIVFQRI